MEKRAVKTAIDVLKMANEYGEIGYAYGGKNDELELIVEAESNGWIVYHEDRSIGGRGDLEGRPFQERHIFKITEAGKEAIKKEFPDKTKAPAPARSQDGQ